MATVESWFLRFTQSVTRRLPRADWPPPTDEFWDEFRQFLVRHGATEQATREALSDLAEDPPKFVGELVPRFKIALQSVWKRSEVENAGVAHGSFAEAQALSRDCDDCGGEGQVIVFHRKFLRSIAAHCECASGRWLYDSRLAKDPAIKGKLLRLLDVKSGLTSYVLEQPPLESLRDGNGTPLPEVWARNNPPKARQPRRDGLGELVPVVPIEPRPVAAVAPIDPGNDQDVFS